MIKTPSGKRYSKTSKVINYGGFRSLKNNKTLFSMSELEQNMFLLFEFDKQVVRYDSQALRVQYQFRGRKRSYTPDIVAKYADGSFKSFEVKPAYKLSQPDIKAKFKVLTKHFIENEGHPLSFLTEKDIYEGAQLSNFKEMYRLKKALRYKTVEIPMLPLDTLSFGELVALCENEHHAKSLLAMDLFTWDMTKPLDNKTLLEGENDHE